MGNKEKIVQVKKVDSKGRVTLPREIREEENIEEGDRVIFSKMPNNSYFMEKRNGE